MRHTLTLVIVYGVSVAAMMYHKTFAFFVQVGIVPAMISLSGAIISFIPYIVVPVFVLFVFNGVQKVLVSHRMRTYIPRMIAQCIITLLLFSLIGIAVGVFVRPGQVSQEGYRTFVQEMQRYVKVEEPSLYGSLGLQIQNLWEYVSQVVAPVFDDVRFLDQRFFIQSGTTMRYLGVLALLLSVVVVSMRRHQKDVLQRKQMNMFVLLCDRVGVMFMWMMHRMLTWLPVLVLMTVPGVLAYYFYHAPAIAGSMMRLIVTWYVVGIVVMIIITVVIAKSARVSWSTAVHAAWRPSFIAFVTGNSIFSSSSAIQSLIRFLNINKEMSNSMFPLLLLMVRMSHVLYFSLITVFSAQLYGIVLSPWVLIYLCILSVCMAFLSIGTYGIASVLFCGMILFILGIPLTPSLWVIVLLDIFISPMRNMLATHGAMMLVVLLRRPHGIHEHITRRDNDR